MSDKPSTITPRLLQLEREIGAFWNGVEDQIDQIRNLGEAAVRGAWEIGKRLLEAKSILGHGQFGIWKERNGIPETTAFRYMALATKFPLLENLPANKREAYLAIGLLPEKEQVQHEGNIQLPASPKNHFNFFNKWSAWKSEVDDRKITFEVTPDVLTELRPMYEWMKGLYES